MIFNELTIHTTTAGSEVISGILFNEGITCFSVDDPQDLADLLENNEKIIQVKGTDLITNRCRIIELNEII